MRISRLEYKQAHANTVLSSGHCAFADFFVDILLSFQLAGFGTLVI
jgi:hypothetical protein